MMRMVVIKELHRCIVQPHCEERFGGDVIVVVVLVCVSGIPMYMRIYIYVYMYINISNRCINVQRYTLLACVHRRR